MHNFDPPYAHNDVKSGNVLITHRKGQPPLAILMDFGSARPARRQIRSRSEALQLQVLVLSLSLFIFLITMMLDFSFRALLVNLTINFIYGHLYMCVFCSLYDIIKRNIVLYRLSPSLLISNVLKIYCIFCTLVMTVPASWTFAVIIKTYQYN